MRHGKVSGPCSGERSKQSVGGDRKDKINHTLDTMKSVGPCQGERGLSNQLWQSKEQEEVAVWIMGHRLWEPK